MVLRIDASIFVLISVSCVLTAGNDVNEGGDAQAHSERQGLWFGPRLGKRSLPDDDNRDLYLRLMEAAEAMKYYYSQLPVSMLERSDPDTRVSKKVIFTPKLGRSVEDSRLEFTPRLGRRQGGDLADRSMEEGSSRARYFSPRLGRNMNFSPRLGRELSEDYQIVRVARSVNKTNNKQQH